MGSLLAICFNAGLASAQVMAGKFTIPFEARWSDTTLAAGDYSFTLDHVGPSNLLKVSRGAKCVGLIMNLSYDAMEPSSGATLVVVRDSTGNTVSDLRLPEIGMVLHYAPQKASRSSQAERELAMMIPVKNTGK